MISFCIPTYNRGRFIGETIEAIEKSGIEQYEVVVYDGGSTDNTDLVLSTKSKSNPKIKYFRAHKNSGVDIDLQMSVELATGEYCWLMSSDDVVISEKIKGFVNFLESRNQDIYLVDFLYCDRNLATFKKSNIIQSNRMMEFFDTTDRNDLRRYYKMGRSNNVVFCYMSNIVFKKSIWNQGATDGLLDAKCYAHAYRLNKVLAVGCKVCVYRDHLICNRGNNDSFEHLGVEMRYLLDFDGYIYIAHKIHSDDVEMREAFLSLTRKEHQWFRLLKFRAALSETVWQENLIKLKTIGYSQNILWICGKIGTWSRLVRLLVLLNNRLNKWRAVSL